MAEKPEDMLIALSDRLVPRSWEGGYTALSEAEKTFVRVWELEAEVNNGGLEQYYANSTGENALDAVAALQRISAGKAAALVEQANKVFPATDPPRQRSTRQSLLEMLGDKARSELERLDQKFFEFPDDLSQLLFDYVIAHKPAFADLSGG